MSMHVLDVSNHQGTGFKLGGYDGYLFKATEGIYFVDKTCDIFVEQAKKLNKPWGVYHFMDGSDVISQANFFYNNVKGYIGKGMMVLDYETYGRQGVNAVERFCKEFKRLSGVDLVLYMNESDSNSHVWTDYIKKNHALWIAKYSSQKPNHTGGLNVIGWQYTSTPVDKSWFYMTEKEWNLYAKKENAPLGEIEKYHTTGTVFKAKADIPIRSKDNWYDLTGVIIHKGSEFTIKKIINNGKTTHAILSGDTGMVTLHRDYVDKVK